MAAVISVFNGIVSTTRRATGFGVYIDQTAFTGKHPWNVSPGEAIAIQDELAPRVMRQDDFGSVRTVAGADVAFPSERGISCAAVVVLRLSDLSLVEQARVEQPTRFTYVPGLLSFREVPALMEALAELERLPDLILCDGQGVAHPRRLGGACHLGVLTGLPTVGVAKSRLLGRHGKLPRNKGARLPLRDKGEVIGTVLRSRSNVRPLYISPGHRVGLDSAVDFTMQCLGRYRLPETTRAADRLAATSPDS